MTTIDEALLKIVGGAQAQSVQDVMAKMQAIDALLPNQDGLKWFNRIYWIVTEKVDEQPVSAWQDAEWLLALDVVFARLYFKAVADSVSGAGGVPRAWQALMDARYRPGVGRVQFALAGMNAHIDRDLALALGDETLGTVFAGAQATDYIAVNELLEAVMSDALAALAGDIEGMAAEDTGLVGRAIAMWDIRRARELAWDFGERLSRLEGVARDVALDAQDVSTGALGVAILDLV